MKKENLFKILMVAAAACLIYGIASGIRANYGIMLNAIMESSDLPYDTVSFVLAVAQLMVGVMQPAAGILAFRKSNAFVLCGGAVMMVVGLICIPFCHSALSLLLFLGVILACGTGAIAFAIIMGAVTPVLGEKAAAVVSGFISASSGLGGTILSPLMQFLIDAVGLRAMLGCILTGFLDTVFDNKRVLGSVYASRVLIILSLLLLSKTPAFVYITAFLFGLSGNATVPPTSGLLTKLFGSKKLATLYGMAFLVHQVGMFFSSWLGGVFAAATGSFTSITTFIRNYIHIILLSIIFDKIRAPLAASCLSCGRKPTAAVPKIQKKNRLNFCNRNHYINSSA